MKMRLLKFQENNTIRKESSHRPQIDVQNMHTHIYTLILCWHICHILGKPKKHLYIII